MKRKRPHIPSKYRKLIWVSYSGKCAYCGKYTGSVFHIDHIKPFSKGGNSLPSNLALAHVECNLRKGTYKRNPRKPNIIIVVVWMYFFTIAKPEYFL